MRDRTSGTKYWEYEYIGVHVSGSAGIEFPLDVFAQARDAVWVSPGAWEAETKWQFGRRICRQGSRDGRVCGLERLKTDVAHRVEVGCGIL